MASMRSIEIDFDVHQKIELARTCFDESPNDALRRLLGLADKPRELDRPAPNATLDGRPWSWKGVTLPHGTELRMGYNGREYSGVVSDGSWLVEGQKASSPSKAAKLVARTKDGSEPSLNGWIYWQVKRPGERAWKPLQSLHKP